MIHNLNDLQSDVVFIKNIDNVVPDEQRRDTVIHKKLLGGILLATRKQVFQYVNKLKQAKASRSELNEILLFLQNNFAVTLPNSTETTKPVYKQPSSISSIGPCAYAVW